MTPTWRVVLALILSVVWAVAFVVAVDRDALYPILGAVAAIVVLIVWATDAGVRAALRPGVRDIIVGVAVGVVSVLVTHAGFAIVAPELPTLVADVERLQRVASVTPARLGVVVLIAVAEELLWRGLLLDALRQRGLGPVPAVVSAAVVYGLSQVGPRSAWLVVAGVAFGVVWGGLRLRSGALWMPVVAHVLWTLGILGIVPLR